MRSAPVGKAPRALDLLAPHAGRRASALSVEHSDDLPRLIRNCFDSWSDLDHLDGHRVRAERRLACSCEGT
eukprot:4616430-Pyramimonas_sp.AAC.1